MMKRRDFCKVGAGTAAVVGMGGLVGPTFSLAESRVREPESDQVGKIYQLQAAFHRAKTTQDIELMMSLWDINGILHNQGDPNSPYIGFDQLRSFWQRSGSFTHRRFSLVPSFKIQIDVRGNQARLYFECHDIGDFDLTSRFIATDTFLAGTLRKVGEETRQEENEGRREEEGRDSRWVFWEMTAGKAFPLSVDHYYFP
jgi:hypothetical protein